MSLRIRRTFILALSYLAISGCSTETIYRDAPDSGTEQSGTTDNSNPLSPTTGDGTDGSGNMVPGGTDNSNANTGTGTGTGTGTDTNTDSGTGTDTDNTQLEDPTQSGNTGNSESGLPQLQQPDIQAVEGEPGMSVDCQMTLPCRWHSTDTQFSLTLTSADNIASRGRLQLDYSIQTFHDTEVSVSSTANAFEGSGLSYIPGEQLLGKINSSTSQTLLAGTPVDGTVIFDEEAAGTSLSQWSITVLDNGIARTATFENIPVGSLTNSYANCEMVLPCIWVSPQNDVSITLTSMGDAATTGRLSTHFIVQTAVESGVVLDAGATALSTNGFAFDGRTHELANQIGSEMLVVQNGAGARVTGAVHFYRSPNIPAALQDLQLILYSQNPVPRWNPRFANVPVQ